MVKKDVHALASTSAPRRHAEELLQIILERQRSITQGFYDIGDALRQIKKKKLYAALGYPTFTALLEARGIMGKTQAFKLIGIVEAYPRDVALRLGPEKAYALTRLAAAGPTPVLATTLLAQGVKIRGKMQKVEAVTAHDLEEQTKVILRARSNGRRDPERHAAEALAKDAIRTLRAWGGERVAVRAQRSGGGWVARIELTMASLEEILRRRS